MFNMNLNHILNNQFSNLDFSKTPEKTIDVSLIDGTTYYFRNCNFYGLTLSLGGLGAEAVFENCNFETATLKNCDLVKMTFSNCNLELTQFEKIKGELRLENCEVKNGIMINSKLTLSIVNCNFFNFNIRDIDPLDFSEHTTIKNSVFDTCAFRNTYLESAEILNSKFNNTSFYDCVMEQMLIGNSVFENIDMQTSRLEGAVVECSKMQYVDLPKKGGFDYC